MKLRERGTIITLIVLGLIVIVVGAIVLYIVNENYEATHKPDIARMQPETSVAYKDMSGAQIDLLAYEGKPLIVNAWATWSPFSKDELVAFAELKREYKDAFEVLAMNRKESPATIAAYLGTIGDTSGVTFVQDESDHFFTTMTGYAMPETIYYNEDGNIVAHVRGNQTREEIRTHIEAMLGEEANAE